MTVAIIDYGSGNLHSAAKAFERAAAEAGGSGAAITVTSAPEDVRSADRIVLPGVGAFADCAAGLRAVDGLLDAITEKVRGGTPFLGICVGMQLMAGRGLEHGVTPGLGWIGGEVRQIKPRDPALKIPHMGWNTLVARREHPLLDGIPMGDDGWHAYFVHSYHFAVEDAANLVAETEYGGRVTAIVARDNIAGTQFHPEKSQKLGLRLISNFLQWRP